MRPSLSKRDEKIIYWVLVGILAVAICAFLFVKCTGFSIQLPMCIFLRLTGCYCPGCGGTRAFVQLLKGHILTSFYYHPVVLYGAIVCGWYLISHTIEYVTKGKCAIGMRYRDIYLYAAIILILLNWMIKNLFLLAGGIRLI